MRARRSASWFRSAFAVLLPLFVARCQLSDQPIHLFDAGADTVQQPMACATSDAGQLLRNPCGGCTTLFHEPGAPCGTCGKYSCSSKESLECVDPGYAQIKSVVSGDVHMCVLMTYGGVRCWGFNLYGEVGVDGGPSRSTPTDRDILTGVQAIAAGYYHMCALMDNGDVMCWGANGDGQLGDGTLVSAFTPVKAKTPTGVRSIFAGNVHTCVVMADNGGLRCWGANGEGELGSSKVGDVEINDDPMDMARLDISSSDFLTDVLTGAASSHTCVIMRATNGVRCWGDNMFGQLGNNDAPNDLFTPPAMDLDIGAGVSKIAVGIHHTCVVANGVQCWGENQNGELGDGTGMDRWQPSKRDVMTNVESITAGFKHTCVRTTLGGVRCWGDNSKGQLGDGNFPAPRYLPPEKDVLTNVKAVIAGGDHTCAWMVAGGLRCWGDNSEGVLGDGSDVEFRVAPPSEDIPGLDRICPP